MIVVKILGIDIGGTGIKGAIVNTETGVLETERYRIPTPQPATPEKVAETLLKIAGHFEWQGPIGAGFPAAIQHGTAKTASNVDKSFIGTNLEQLFSKHTGCPVFVANDADVAGLAEFTFGEGKQQQGLIILITIGTGIGTALINDGVLQPNSELGHVWLDNGLQAEPFASNAVRKALNLSWSDWGERLNKYLSTMENLFYPDLFVIGGGVSKSLDQFESILDLKTPVRAASFLNQSGIVGAALYGATQYKH